MAADMVLNFPDKLWDMANLLTAFAVAQALATTFSLAKQELKALKGATGHWMTLCITLIFTAFYIWAILRCGSEGREFVEQQQQRLWDDAIHARVGAVVLFTVILLLALIGHWREDPSSKLRRTAPDEAV